MPHTTPGPSWIVESTYGERKLEECSWSREALLTPRRPGQEEPDVVMTALSFRCVLFIPYDDRLVVTRTLQGNKGALHKNMS